MRVGFALRSAEIKPLFQRFVLYWTSLYWGPGNTGSLWGSWAGCAWVRGVWALVWVGSGRGDALGGWCARLFSAKSAGRGEGGCVSGVLTPLLLCAPAPALARVRVGCCARASRRAAGGQWVRAAQWEVLL